MASALVLAGCIGASAAPAALAAPAHPATASPAVAGSYTNWRAAQHAAGFKLLKPGKTLGLRRVGRIDVQVCQLTSTVARNTVSANLGGSDQRSVMIQEVNYHIPCGNLGEAKKLGHYRVDGVRATLYGSCGLPGLPSCHARKIGLDLFWVRRGKSYAVLCFAIRRSAVLAFARAMRPVS